MKVSHIQMMLSRQTMRIMVKLDGTLKLTFQTPDENDSEPRKLNKKLSYMKVKKGPIAEKTKVFYWKPPGFTFRTVHVCSIFMEDLKFHRDILMKYSRQFNKLTLDYHSLKSQEFHSILSLNYDRFCLEKATKLEDLLVSNISEMHIDYPSPLKQVCLFLKHWINGSNKRLEYLEIKLPARSTETQFISIALNGIKYQLAPIDKKWEFLNNRFIKTTVVKAGGYDIRQNDGTIATVTFYEAFPYLRMFVWKDRKSVV